MLVLRRLGFAKGLGFMAVVVLPVSQRHLLAIKLPKLCIFTCALSIQGIYGVNVTQNRHMLLAGQVGSTVADPEENSAY